MNDLKLLKKEIINKTPDDLHKDLKFLKKELFNLRFQQTMGDLKNTSRFSGVKKLIAHINTELTKRSKIEGC